MNQTAELIKENQQLRDQLDQQSQEIHQLKEMVHSLTHRQFGTSSEKNPDQRQLFDEAENDAATDNEESALDDSEAISVPAHQRKKQKRVSIPDWIEREEIIHDLPESEKVCPHDGSTLKCIGEETHEQLDIIPAQIKALRHIRKKYACPCCEGYLVTAPKPKQPIEKSIASPGLLTHIILGKYADALPLYRQTAIYKRLGIELDRSSLANWMIRCGDLLQPLINLLQDRILEQDVVH
ncbi:MAG TPA: IS66 family transposase, partial [Methylophaga aminisulfidivorans]|nr:IS66 family transposase [Methylophaga aminisulfidivorans]